MKNKFLCLMMAALLLFAVPVNVSAEEYEGSKDWSAVFDGHELASNFTSAQMAEEILNIQPGDSTTVYCNVENIYSETVDWYMSNEVLRTLEESNQVAEGGAYTYVLTYHDHEGNEKVLYDSEVVGGEEDTSKEGEGLHQATNALEDYFYLDRLAKGDKGYISLFVMLDGESQGNDYQDTLARVQLNFAVELVNKEIIKTGDETPIVMFSAATLASGLLFLGLAVVAMRRRREEEGV